jgi:hypothetical protein
MALETVEQVTEAIRAIVDGDHPNGMKPVERRVRAARLADLYEIRAQLWRELGVKVRGRLVLRIPDEYATACAVAEKHDRGQVTFFRGMAGSR